MTPKITAVRAHSFAAVFQSMKDELLPYQGRAATVVRMVIATLITMLITMGWLASRGRLGRS